MMDAAYTAPPQLDRVQKNALIVGVVALALWAVGFVVVEDRSQVFRSYLLGFIYWLMVALGSFALLMIQHLSGGAWGIVIRRSLEAATRTLPLIVVLFLPLAASLVFSHLYIWTDEALVSQDHHLQAKTKYLNLPFFYARAVMYFLVWFGLGYLLNKWSRQQDEASDPRAFKRKMQDLSGPGLVFLGGAVTFASVDWLMSLDPKWMSTIFGILFMGGMTLTALAFIITMMVTMAKYEPMSHVIAGRHLNDLGKLMLAFVMLWAYFSFSQFLISWSGNLPEEVPWYMNRLQGGWKLLAGGLILFHFALPFFLLLPRRANRNAKLLVTVAILVLVMRFVDLYWLVGPATYTGITPAGGDGHGGAQFHFHWLDIVAPVGVGGVWVWFFIAQLKKLPLLPIQEPELEGALGEGEGHH